jgi:hypothetical protein
MWIQNRPAQNRDSRSKEAARLMAFPLVTLGGEMIDLEDLNRPTPRKSPQGEGIEARTQNQVLLDRAAGASEDAPRFWQIGVETRRLRRGTADSHVWLCIA